MVRLDPAIADALCRRAHALGCSLSDVAGRLITDGLVADNHQELK
jgi:hypothetical protein